MIRSMLVGLLLLLALPARAAEPGPPASGAVRIETNRQVLGLVDALVHEGRHDEARTVMGDWQPDHPDHAIRLRYVEGRIAAARGENAEAVDIFRAILAERPGLEQVRLSLAAALYRSGEDDAARFHAEQLIAAGVDDRVGGTLQGVVRSIDARRPVRFSGYVSILPSTNVNNGPRSSRFSPDSLLRIPDEDRQQSGIGGLVGGQVILRRPFDGADPEGTALVGTVEGALRSYPSISRSLVTAEASAGIEETRGRTRLLPSAFVGVNAEDFDVTRKYAGLRLEASTTVPPAWRLSATPGVRYEQIVSNTTGQEDGWFYDVPLQIDNFFGPSRFGRLIFGHGGARKEAARFSFDEWRAGVGAFAELPFGMTVYAQGTWAERDYRGDYFGLSEPRDDRRLTGILAITKRDLNLFGFAPRIVYVFERNYSNVVFFDTTRHDVELRLTKEF